MSVDIKRTYMVGGKPQQEVEAGDDMDALGQNKWSNFRQRCYVLVNSSWMDNIVGMVIVANTILMIVDTDHRSHCVGGDESECYSALFDNLALLFLIFYTCEVSLGFYVFRIATYFKNPWRILDCTVVCFGWLDLLMSFMIPGGIPGPGTTILRLVRIGRLIRTAKIFRAIPELNLMIHQFISAITAVAWGVLLILLILIIWSIVCVDILHPINVNLIEDGLVTDEWCKDAFSSVLNCTLLFFQTLVAGDSWGMCALPIIRYHFALSIFFIVALAVAQLGFLNLIVAVIVDRANATHDADLQQQAALKDQEEARHRENLKEMLQECDTDTDGHITYEELLQAHESHPKLSFTLKSLNMGPDNLKTVFDLIDLHNSGSIPIDDMIDRLRTARGHDVQEKLSMHSLQISAILKRLEDAKDKERSPSKQVDKLQEDKEVEKGMVDLRANLDKQIVSVSQAESIWAGKGLHDLRVNLDRHMLALSENIMASVLPSLLACNDIERPNLDPCGNGHYDLGLLGMEATRFWGGDANPDIPVVDHVTVDMPKNGERCIGIG